MQVAESYSGTEKGSIFEIKFDAASPGADLQFLSQYPGEREMLYPPGTQLTCQHIEEDNTRRVLKLTATYNPDNLLKQRISSIRSLDDVPAPNLQPGAHGVVGPAASPVKPGSQLAEEALRTRLDELSLSQFADAIIKAGYDSVKMVSELNETDLACAACETAHGLQRPPWQRLLVYFTLALLAVSNYKLVRHPEVTGVCSRPL